MIRANLDSSKFNSIHSCGKPSRVFVLTIVVIVAHYYYSWSLATTAEATAISVTSTEQAGQGYRANYMARATQGCESVVRGDGALYDRHLLPSCRTRWWALGLSRVPSLSILPHGPVFRLFPFLHVRVLCVCEPEIAGRSCGGMWSKHGPLWGHGEAPLGRHRSIPQLCRGFMAVHSERAASICRPCAW